jgi:GNAT superfamily N-acetyltransferase
VEGARTATEADLPRIAELCRQALTEIRAQERGGELMAMRDAREEPVEGSLADALQDPRAAVVVGTIDAEVVGYATGRAESLRDGATLGVIQDLFVEPEARGVGVGTAVMDELLAWFSGQGCLGVDAMALPGARATKNFFEGTGFSARLIVMHHRLTGSGSQDALS